MFLFQVAQKKKKDVEEKVNTIVDRTFTHDTNEYWRVANPDNYRPRDRKAKQISNDVIGYMKGHKWLKDWDAKNEMSDNEFKLFQCIYKMWVTRGEEATKDFFMHLKGEKADVALLQIWDEKNNISALVAENPDMRSKKAQKWWKDIFKEIVGEVKEEKNEILELVPKKGKDSIVPASKSTPMEASYADVEQFKNDVRVMIAENILLLDKKEEDKEGFLEKFKGDDGQYSVKKIEKAAEQRILDDYGKRLKLDEKISDIEDYFTSLSWAKAGIYELSELDEWGLAKFYREGQKPPEGYGKLDYYELKLETQTPDGESVKETYYVALTNEAKKYLAEPSKKKQKEAVEALAKNDANSELLQRIFDAKMFAEGKKLFPNMKNEEIRKMMKDDELDLDNEENTQDVMDKVRNAFEPQVALGTLKSAEHNYPLETLLLTNREVREKLYGNARSQREAKGIIASFYNDIGLPKDELYDNGKITPAKVIEQIGAWEKKEAETVE